MKAKNLLELRNANKRRKPDFLRQCVGEKRKLGSKWRKPRGLHSKIRRKYRGHSVRVLVGYKSPAEVRGMTRNGLKPVLVVNLSQLSNLDKSNGIIIDSKVGSRKKIEIISHANKKGIAVLNFKDSESFVKTTEAQMKYRKSIRAELLKYRKDKKEVKAEVKKEANKVDKGGGTKVDKAESYDHKHEDGHMHEDQKNEEKKERDKILVQKD